MNRSIVSEGFVLSTKSFSEADKIIVVYSKTFGKVSLMAKGVKKLKSRKRAALEIFSKIKFIAFKGNAMPIITEAEIIDSMGELKKDLTKISVAYFIVEIIAKTTQEEQKNEEIYELLNIYLNKLKGQVNLKKLRTEFSIKLLEMQGFIPKGQFVPNIDDLLESVIERKLGSVRVGKKLQG